MNVIAGVHPVLEALTAGRSLERLHIARGAGGPRLQQIIDQARQSGVPVRFEPRPALDRLSRQAAHQGVVAIVTSQRYTDLESLIDKASLFVLLDGVTDPHNLGAIIRTAHAAGAGAVVVTDRRAAPLTETVAKTAAGALEHLPVVRIGNLSQTIEILKSRGFWIYGLDERGDVPYDRASFEGRIAIVLGSEGQGLHQQVRKHCDFLVSIPLAGRISSLNVSVACGIVLFEWKRRRAAPR
jgi:23S rRNA (guanosine2251-2'-O)-methyltransferase